MRFPPKCGVQGEGCRVWQHDTCVGIAEGQPLPRVFHCEQCRAALADPFWEMVHPVFPSALLQPAPPPGVGPGYIAPRPLPPNVRAACYIAARRAGHSRRTKCYAGSECAALAVLREAMCCRVKAFCYGYIGFCRYSIKAVLNAKVMVRSAHGCTG